MRKWWQDWGLPEPRAIIPNFCKELVDVTTSKGATKMRRTENVVADRETRIADLERNLARNERAYEIVCELQQCGHPCDCEFCEPLWQEVYRMMTEGSGKK